MALLDDLQQQIDRRLDELRPAFTEYSSLQQLRTAIANLDPDAAIAQVQRFPFSVGAEPAAEDGREAPVANGTPSVAPAGAALSAGATATVAAGERPAPAPRRRKPTRTRESTATVSPDVALQNERAALELISSKPGLTAVQLAKRMGVPASVLFRLLPTLQRDGRIRKQGKGYLPN